jgi:hypothetical protein
MKSIEPQYCESHICSIETQIEILPSEILTQIFSYLSLFNRIRTSQVCKYWRAVIINLYKPGINKIGTINESLRSLIDNINSKKYKKIIEKIESLKAVSLTQSNISVRELQMEKARIRDECARYLKKIDEDELKLVDLNWPAEKRGALADVIRVALLVKEVDYCFDDSSSHILKAITPFADLFKHLNILNFIVKRDELRLRFRGDSLKRLLF